MSQSHRKVGTAGGVSRETSSAEVSRETVLDTPIAREALQAVNVMNIHRERWPKPPDTRVITVANQKGGVGKTTSAVNIAAAMAMHGLRVLVIDLDPQGNASTALGVDHSVGTPSMYDVLLGDGKIADVVASVEISETLFCAPARISTTSSSTARRRSACSRSTRWSGLAKCSSRFSASTTPSKDWRNC